MYDAYNDGVLLKWLIIRLLAYLLIYGLYAVKKHFVENIRFLSGVENRPSAILVHYNQLSGRLLHGCQGFFMRFRNHGCYLSPGLMSGLPHAP